LQKEYFLRCPVRLSVFLSVHMEQLGFW